MQFLGYIEVCLFIFIFGFLFFIFTGVIAGIYLAICVVKEKIEEIIENKKSSLTRG